MALLSYEQIGFYDCKNMRRGSRNVWIVTVTVAVSLGELEEAIKDGEMAWLQLRMGTQEAH